MKLKEAFYLFNVDPEFRAHITTIIDMTHELYWNHNTCADTLKNTVQKLTGKEIANHIVTMIEKNKTTFLV